MSVIKIPIDKIRPDQTFQIRQLDEPTVEAYMEVEEFRTPPYVKSIASADEYILLDGFHRIEALKRNGCTEATVKVLSGSDVDLLLASARQNTSHGRAYTRDEKEELCGKLLIWLDREGKVLSSAQIAKVCGISGTTVVTYRNKLVRQGKISEPKSVVDKDGKRRSSRNRMAKKLLLYKVADASRVMLEDVKKVTSCDWTAIDDEERPGVIKDLQDLSIALKKALGHIGADCTEPVLLEDTADQGAEAPDQQET